MSKFIYQPLEDSDFLIHHGIKGQKWGEQNGPPYPLDPKKDYSKAEQKANADFIYEHEKSKSLGQHIKEEVNPEKIVETSSLKKKLDELNAERNELIVKRDSVNDYKAYEYFNDKIKKIEKEKNDQINKIIDNIVGEYGDKFISVINGTVKDTLERNIRKQVDEIVDNNKSFTINDMHSSSEWSKFYSNPTSINNKLNINSISKPSNWANAYFRNY